ncbi:MAG: hypothetical protein R3D46_06960 [Defluviimonas denitrificans]
MGFPSAVLLALLAAAPAPAQELEICTWHQVIVGQARDIPRRVDLVTVIYRAPEGSPWAGSGFAEGLPSAIWSSLPLMRYRWAKPSKRPAFRPALRSGSHRRADPGS